MRASRTPTRLGALALCIVASMLVTSMLVTSMLVTSPSGATITTTPAASYTRCGWDTTLMRATHTPSELATMITTHMPTKDLITLVGLRNGSLSQQNLYPGLPAYCIPAMVLHDGPNGLTVPGAIALPDEITLGATFDPTLAARYGQVLATVAKADHIAAIQAPDVNMAVNPRWGRNAETYGEDPFLTGALAAAEVKGIQQNGTLAIIKHVGVYTQELDRVGLNTVVNQRALQELYFAPATAVTRSANPAGAMCALGYLNGLAQCANSQVYQTLNQAGFSGFMRSDYRAATHQVAALRAGIDLVKPRNPVVLEAALRSHTITRATLVRAVDQVLTTLISHRDLIRHGAFAWRHPRAVTPQVILARSVSDESTILLKNNEVLPLSRHETVAVIGSEASQPTNAEWGSSGVPDLHPVTPLDGIRAAAGLGVHYTSANVSLGKDMLSPHAHVTTTKGFRRTALRYVATTNQQVEFALARSAGPEVAQLNVDAKRELTLDFVRGGGVASDSVTLYMTKGLHRIEVSWAKGSKMPVVKAVNVTPGLADATRAARAARVAIVVVGTPTGENLDRASLDLGGYQDQLVDAVAKANPRTIVVIEAGGAVLTPWRNEVAGIVDQLYPGREGGVSLGRVLSGMVNPSGKLDFTMPQSEPQSPANEFDTSAFTENLNAIPGSGLDVGYRWYRATNTPAAFAFGYGLSYTSFSTGPVTRAVVPAGWQFSTMVTNTGQRTGRDVLEGYVAWPNGVSEPVSLKGFTSVTLAPGEYTQAAITIYATSLESYLAGKWTLTPGTYHFYLGSDALHLGPGVAFTVR